jgi:predicted methyltransferase
MKQKLPPILKSDTAKQILSGKTRVSLDLGLTHSDIEQKNDKISFPDGQNILKEDLTKISEKDNVVFFISEGQVFMVAVSNGNYYKLVPTDGAPTIEIDGIRMHRTKDVTPEVDTAAKLDALGKVSGSVLDTCMGLGYTAIEAHRRGATEVITVDLKPSVLKISAMNPWSQDLFKTDGIHPVIANSFTLVNTFPDNYFNSIIHDPPRHNLAGLLYSKTFYQKIFKIMKRSGRLFHYVGEPRAKYRGVNLIRGVQNRLREVGFHSLKIHRDVRGITCTK